MKKSIRMMMLLAMMLVAYTAKAQVVFSAFKLKPTLLYYSKELYASFTCDGEKKVKYVKVEWCAVNEVGDVSVGMTPNLQLRTVSSTGPFDTNRKYKRVAKNGFLGVEKVHAMPVSICIEYMDGTDWEQDVTKDNYKQFFPNLKWIDFTVPGE
nr:MAG TPA: hypothetical protein [Caudoviricetes sp.]